MKIAILTSGILPIPATRGGAVENLIDFYLEYNDQHRMHDITVYSIWHPSVKKHPALQSGTNHYRYINTNSLIAKVKKRVQHYLHHNEEFYHYTIEYYLHKALRHIRQQHYDIIILENRPGFALKLKRQTTARLVFHLHNDILNYNIPHHQEIYDAAVRILTVSNYITNCVRTINPQDTKCLTIYNGIDTNIFKSINTQNFPIAKPNHSSKDFIIIFSGRLIPEKGILPLIQALRLLKEHKDIHLMILGSTSLGSSNSPTPFQQELHEAAKGLNNITFTGYIDYSIVGSYLQLADIAVLPSLWEEPFGLTCVEALAAGLPLITTRKGGIPEVTSPDCTTILDVTPTLPQDLASAILDLYTHSEKRKQMSDAALKHSRQFCKERYAYDFFKALERIKEV